MMLHCAQADHLLPCVWMHPSQTCNLQVGYLEAPVAQFVSPRLDDNSCRLGAIETLHDPRYCAVLQPEPAWRCVALHHDDPRYRDYVSPTPAPALLHT